MGRTLFQTTRHPIPTVAATGPDDQDEETPKDRVESKLNESTNHRNGGVGKSPLSFFREQGKREQEASESAVYRVKERYISDVTNRGCLLSKTIRHI